MQDQLLDYYNKELAYLRLLGAEYASRYPKVAAQLKLEAGRSDDPHVERLLEGFAFLAARVQLRIDEDLPEVTETLLDVLHPQFVRPIPSFAIVQFELEPSKAALPAGFAVPRHSAITSPPVEIKVRDGTKHVACTFRTCYTTALWPMQVTGAEWTTAARSGATTGLGAAIGAVRLQLGALAGLRLGALRAPSADAGAGDGPGLDTLRLHLAGDAHVTETLYELLVNNCTHVVVRDPANPTRPPVVLPASAIRPVGFEPDEMLLPYPRRVFAGYALLQELFVFPAKFLFVDVAGLGDALRALDAGPSAEVYFVIGPTERPEDVRQTLEIGITPRTFRLGCSPAVNLFPQRAEQILVDQRQPEYLVVPDARQRAEIETWSVEEVTGRWHERSDTTPIEPLYALRAGRAHPEAPVFWHSVRRENRWRKDGGTDVYVSFAEASGEVRAPDSDVVSLNLLCFNGDLPSQLRFGQDDRPFGRAEPDDRGRRPDRDERAGHFTSALGGPVGRVVCLTNPTKAIQPALGKPMLWRLVSSLSLNHLSLVEDGGEALRELLRLHNMSGSEWGRRQIEGLVGVSSRATHARVNSAEGLAFARGRRIDLVFDEPQFTGGGIFLFASVLERFLGMYTTMNSFTQLVAHSKRRTAPVREWKPRAGCRTLL